MEKLIEAGDFLIYPNPAKDMIPLFKVCNPEPWSLINSTGKLFKNFELSETTAKIDISTLPAGVSIHYG